MDETTGEDGRGVDPDARYSSSGSCCFYCFFFCSCLHLSVSLHLSEPVRAAPVFVSLLLLPFEDERAWPGDVTVQAPPTVTVTSESAGERLQIQVQTEELICADEKRKARIFEQFVTETPTRREEAEEVRTSQKYQISEVKSEAEVTVERVQAKTEAQTTEKPKKLERIIQTKDVEMKLEQVRAEKITPHRG
ncbi:hypothetical protein WMY93_002269 [Mugilogobius chulae]|uniref:Uncharacterized protein n=1 Tax=Mugilogobius chulae TaxID=88201 RepID=A0AAW0PT43_9GOBI